GVWIGTDGEGLWPIRKGDRLVITDQGHVVGGFEHCRLRREMGEDRRAADPRRGGHGIERRPHVAALREEPGGDLEQVPPRLARLRRTAWRPIGSGLDRCAGVDQTAHLIIILTVWST